MLFWFLLPATLITLLALHYTYVTSAKPDGNLVLGVAIPHAQLSHPKLKEILTAYQSISKRLFWSLFFLQGVGFFLRTWVSLSLLWLFAYMFGIIAVYAYFLEKYSKQVKQLKQAEHWMQSTGQLLHIDTELSRLKNTFSVKWKWFFPPLLVLVPTILVRLQTVPLSVLAAPLAMMLAPYCAGIICYIAFERTSTVTYSENSQLNLVLNKLFKRGWSQVWMLIAYSSLLHLPFLYLLDETTMYTPFFWQSIVMMSVLSTVTSLVPMVVMHEHIRNKRNRLLSLEQEPLYMDDDTYWTAYSYCNPYDTRVWVPKRFGIGTTVNMATKTGKIFTYGIYGFVLATLAFVLWVSIPCDFGTVAFQVEQDTVSIKFTPYQSEFSKEDIVSLALVEELPSGYKTNGSATDRICAGNFSVKGYGQSKMYVMRQVPLYIAIELTDGSYIFVNGADVETTQVYYQQLGGEL